MYTFQSRIRFSETDYHGRLRLTGLLDYFQDCSVFHSEDGGISMQSMLRDRMAWVTNAWQIVIHRYPVLGEEVIVGTVPYSLKGFIGLRNFFLRSKEGEELAVANSVWSLVNLDTMRPERITQRILDAFPLGEKMQMDYAPRKLPFPEEGEITEKDPVPVLVHHLDSNNHVNNGQYLHIAASLVPEEAVTQLRAEYHKQALLGDVLYPAVHVQKKTDAAGRAVTVYTVGFFDEKKEPYCVTELTQSGA